MLAGLDGAIDVIVPRGGKSLVARVQHEARVPVFAHLEGIVHVYVHGAADLEMAKKIVLNAKMRRTGVCGAAETLLVDRACAATHLAPLGASMLLAAGCAVRGDAATLAADARVTPASEQDWDTEYLDAIIAARVVDGLGRRDDAYSGAWLASHRLHRDAGRSGGGALSRRGRFRRLSSTTPRRNSPMAANSALAAKSASPPAKCTRADRSASSSSLRSNIACTARDRRAREEASEVIPRLPPHAPGPPHNDDHHGRAAGGSTAGARNGLRF